MGTTSKIMIAVIAGLGALATPAHATRFDGSCQVVGEGGYERPAGYLPGANRWWMEGRGGCSGTLDGVKVVNHPVDLRITFDDPFSSCAGSLATGRGALAFKSGRRWNRVLRFDQSHVGPIASITGARGGSGAGYLTAYTQLARQDPAAVSQCASGALTWFAAEWVMKTLAPLEG